VNPALVSTTRAVDPVFIFILGVSVALLVGITVTVVWFVIRYHRSRAPEPTSRVATNIWLEIVWTTISSGLALAMFYYGWEGYLALRTMPRNALPVTATARMWSWNFTYANGKSSSKLYVPVGQPVRVELVTEDVLHGFYLPAFRVKQDVVPGRTTDAWFVADQAGSYDLFCSVYCGAGHSAMITTVEAVPPAEFADWLRQKRGTGHAGKELMEKHGCLGCHSLDGTRKAGPTLQGIWGRQVTVLTGGKERTLTADETYLRRSILEPNADVVKGFPASMPSYTGSLKDEEVGAIIDFLKRGGMEPPKLDGAKLAKERGCLACHSLDGNRGVGPTFKGLYNSRVTVLENGKRITVTVDDAYLRESIRRPEAKIVEGFRPLMPVNQELTDEEVEALVEFIEEVR
jgi:cytochrome c oxidase subunit II